MITNLLPTLEKKLNFLIPSLLISASLITNTSVLPTNYESLTDKSVSNISFTDNGIRKIIKSLDYNKTHGHDMMSIRMLKISEDSIYKPLHLVFTASLDQGTFPLYWKKAKVVPIYKKTTNNQ